MLLRLSLASLVFPLVVAAAGAWPDNDTRQDTLESGGPSSTLSMHATQSPPRAASRAINSKAVDTTEGKVDSRVRTQQSAQQRPGEDHPSKAGTARNYLPETWWPIGSRPPLEDSPLQRSTTPAPRQLQPAPAVANDGEQRLAHPRDIIAGQVPRETPIMDDSEGRADPIGRTLSGATPDEPAGADEAMPEDPPSNDVADDEVNQVLDQVSRPEAEEAAPSEGEDQETSDLQRQSLPPLTAEQIALRDKIRRVRAIYQQKHLNTRDHGNWETMHAIVAYGVDAEIRVGSPYGKKVNAIGWICWNGQCARERMFLLRGDSLQPRNGPGLQGHEGQLLAILAQARVKDNYPLRIGGRDFTLADLVAYEQATCEPNSELTFKLIGLNRYLDPDATWTDRRGRNWSLERLVEEELKQPIIGAACGGTHRLFGLSNAYKRREALGLPVTGHFKRAKIFIEDYHKYAWRLQNSDGSFSTNWFAGRGDNRDIDRKLQTGGHITEWLAFSLPQEQLSDERMRRAVTFIADTLGNNQSRDWRIGPLGHALNSLRIYDERVFKAYDEQEPQQVTAADGDSAAVVGDANPLSGRRINPVGTAHHQNPYASAIEAGRATAGQKPAADGADPNSTASPVVPFKPPVIRTAEQPQVEGPRLINPH